MKPPQSKSFLGSVLWRLRTLFGPAADQVKLWIEDRKETGSAHRGPEVRKRTPVEDAAGAGRQTGLSKVESVADSVADNIPCVVGEFVSVPLSLRSLITSE